jgi:hypothetical protein
MRKTAGPLENRVSRRRFALAVGTTHGYMANETIDFTPRPERKSSVFLLPTVFFGAGRRYRDPPRKKGKNLVVFVKTNR